MLLQTCSRHQTSYFYQSANILCFYCFLLIFFFIQYIVNVKKYAPPCECECCVCQTSEKVPPRTEFSHQHTLPLTLIVILTRVKSGLWCSVKLIPGMKELMVCWVFSMSLLPSFPTFCVCHFWSFDVLLRTILRTVCCWQGTQSCSHQHLFWSK